MLRCVIVCVGLVLCHAGGHDNYKASAKDVLEPDVQQESIVLDESEYTKRTAARLKIGPGLLDVVPMFLKYFDEARVYARMVQLHTRLNRAYLVGTIPYLIRGKNVDELTLRQIVDAYVHVDLMNPEKVREKGEPIPTPLSKCADGTDAEKLGCQLYPERDAARHRGHPTDPIETRKFDIRTGIEECRLFMDRRVKWLPSLEAKWVMYVYLESALLGRARMLEAGLEERTPVEGKSTLFDVVCGHDIEVVKICKDLTSTLAMVYDEYQTTQPTVRVFIKSTAQCRYNTELISTNIEEANWIEGWRLLQPHQQVRVYICKAVGDLESDAEWNPYYFPPALFGCARYDEQAKMSWYHQIAGEDFTYMLRDTVVIYMGCGANRPAAIVSEPFFSKNYEARQAHRQTEHVREGVFENGRESTGQGFMDLCNYSDVSSHRQGFTFGPFWATYIMRIEKLSGIVASKVAYRRHCSNLWGHEKKCAVSIQAQAFLSQWNNVHNDYIYGGDPMIDFLHGWDKEQGWTMLWERIFDAPVSEVMAGVPLGGNVILISYGFSGAGKTATLIGDSKAQVYETGKCGLPGVLTFFFSDYPMMETVKFRAVEVYGRVSGSNGQYLKLGQGFWHYQASDMYLGDLFKMMDDSGRVSPGKVRWSIEKYVHLAKCLPGDTTCALTLAVSVMEQLQAVEKTRNAGEKPGTVVSYTTAYNDDSDPRPHIRFTPNNPSSSRGTTFVMCECMFNFGIKQTMGHVNVVDLAGAENPGTMMSAFVRFKKSDMLMSKGVTASRYYGYPGDWLRKDSNHIATDGTEDTKMVCNDFVDYTPEEVMSDKISPLPLSKEDGIKFKYFSKIAGGGFIQSKLAICTAIRDTGRPDDQCFLQYAIHSTYAAKFVCDLEDSGYKGLPDSTTYKRANGGTFKKKIKEGEEDLNLEEQEAKQDAADEAEFLGKLADEANQIADKKKKLLKKQAKNEVAKGKAKDPDVQAACTLKAKGYNKEMVKLDAAEGKRKKKAAKSLELRKKMKEKKIKDKEAAKKKKGYEAPVWTPDWNKWDQWYEHGRYELTEGSVDPVTKKLSAGDYRKGIMDPPEAFVDGQWTTPKSTNPLAEKLWFVDPGNNDPWGKGAHYEYEDYEGEFRKKLIMDEDLKATDCVTMFGERGGRVAKIEGKTKGELMDFTERFEQFWGGRQASEKLLRVCTVEGYNAAKKPDEAYIYAIPLIMGLGFSLAKGGGFGKAYAGKDLDKDVTYHAAAKQPYNSNDWWKDQVYAKPFPCANCAVDDEGVFNIQNTPEMASPGTSCEEKGFIPAWIINTRPIAFPASFVLPNTLIASKYFDFSVAGLTSTDKNLAFGRVIDLQKNAPDEARKYVSLDKCKHKQLEEHIFPCWAKSTTGKPQYFKPPEKRASFATIQSSNGEVYQRDTIDAIAAGETDVCGSHTYLWWTQRAVVFDQIKVWKQVFFIRPTFDPCPGVGLRPESTPTEDNLFIRYKKMTADFSTLSTPMTEEALGINEVLLEMRGFLVNWAGDPMKRVHWPHMIDEGPEDPCQIVKVGQIYQTTSYLTPFYRKKIDGDIKADCSYNLAVADGVDVVMMATLLNYIQDMARFSLCGFGTFSRTDTPGADRACQGAFDSLNFAQKLVADDKEILKLHIPARAAA